MRRGYIYTLDAAIAIVLIVIALSTLLGSYLYAPRSAEANALSTDILQLMSQTKLSDLCDASCSCAYPQLEGLCQLPSFDTNASLVDVIGQAQARGELDPLARDAVGAVLRGSGAVPRSYGVQVVLTDGANEILVYGDAP